MVKELITLSPYNVYKIVSMFYLNDVAKSGIDNSTEDETEWIINNWNNFKVRNNVSKRGDMLVELNEETIIKVIGGYQLAIQNMVMPEDIDYFIIDNFPFLQINKSGYYRKNNEIFLLNKEKFS